MRTTLAATAVLIAVAAVGVAGHARMATAAPRLELIASTKHAVVLTGVPVTGLYPGAVKALSVRIANRSGRTINVPSLKGKLSAKTSRTGCAGTSANLMLTFAGKAVTIPKNATRTMALTVTMPRTVADACQGATFRIAVKLRATR